MVAALVLLLFLHCPLPWAQEAPSGRLLVLPDVTLSAEDPLYLAIPPAAGWKLEAPAQPALERLRLWGAGAPPRIRDLQALPPVPSSAPRPAVVWPASAPAAAGPPQEAPPAGQPAGRAAGESGLRVVYRTSTTAGIDLWLDRRGGGWETAGSTALTVSGELPSSFAVRTTATLQRGAWRGRFLAEGAGVLYPQDPGFLAGGLGIDLGRDPSPWGLRSVTELRAEQPAEQDDAWLLFRQRLAFNWQGPRLGVYASGLAFAGVRDSPSLRGLARLGLEWAGGPFSLSAGAALSVSGNILQPYPEAGVEVRPCPLLTLQAGFAPYLENPAPFLVRALFGGGQRPALLPEGGLAARFAVSLDASQTGSIAASLQAFDAERLLLRHGLLRPGPSRQLAAGAQARLAVNAGDRRRPRVTLSAGASAGMSLPLSAQAFQRPLYRGLGAGMEIVFPKPLAELILQAHWGDVPVASLPSLIAERRGAAAGWQASLAVRWTVRPQVAVDSGLELREPATLGGLLGCTLHARRSP